MLRFLLWRALAALALLWALCSLLWLGGGGLAAIVHGNGAHPPAVAPAGLGAWLGAAVSGAWGWAPVGGVALLQALSWTLFASACLATVTRCSARRERGYVRMQIEPYRTDRADSQALIELFAALHARLAQTRVRRILLGQPSVALEVHSAAGSGTPRGWFAFSCPQQLASLLQTALRCAYPNCRLRSMPGSPAPSGVLVRLRKQSEFIRRAKAHERFERAPEPPINRVLTVMAAAGGECCVQLALTPAPAFVERLAKRLHASRESSSRTTRAGAAAGRRTMIADAELRGGLELLNVPLFFADIRVIAPTRASCRRIAAQLASDAAENRLVERAAPLRHGLLGLYSRRIASGEGNALPSLSKELYAPSELAGLWQLPSLDYTAVPISRSGVPVAPAPPGIARAPQGEGMLCDEHGPVRIAVELRKQNTAVPGTVEQGKTSFLIATVAEDLRRERCAVIVLDPKGDAADAAVSLVPAARTCTLLEFAHPTCGFNPLAVDAPADVIADYVVAALRNLFSDADIRASSDRYLRNAVIAVLAYDRRSSLWDAARLLTVGEDGYAFRRKVAAAVRGLPEFKEISDFFAAELSAQLADARSTTTAKLDAPVNKLARLLNSASIKRILLNESLTVDFDRIISQGEVLVVKGALGAMGAGNTSVMMQLLVGMLDAALARQQDLRESDRRTAVALKIDEAPLVINRGFAETIALKRSAGLETVACWQTDAQWVEREVRDQLDALFAHRVYFATASARDARSAAALTMPEFSDTVRAGLSDLTPLGRPDVRLHLPKHHAIASWSTSDGRQAAFVGQTIPLRIDKSRIAEHAELQRLRGGRHLTDLRQPHWQDAAPDSSARIAAPVPPREPARTAPPGQASSPNNDAPPKQDAPPNEGVPLPHAPARALAPARPGRSVPPAAAGLPKVPAESYRELVELDRAQSVRRARAPRARLRLEPDRADIEMLLLIGSFGHVLSSQLHRCFNEGRAATTTQRRLKRLFDAGLVGRFQFHRGDGGGVPMCYVLTAAAEALLEAHRAQHGQTHARTADPRAKAARGAAENSPAGLRRIRHEVHVAGYALALGRLLGGHFQRARGPRESAIAVPEGAGGRLGTAQLRLSAGRTPHDFLRTLPGGRRVEAERFETVRPDAVLEAGSRDVLIEFDDRLREDRWTAKLERYDHFLAGWSLHTARYGERGRVTPMLLVVCRDRARARECARVADTVVCACRAYAGEYPFDWAYPGRQRIVFAAERDMHEGSSCAWALARLPPAVRVVAAHEDPRAAEAAPHPSDICQALFGAADSL